MESRETRDALGELGLRPSRALGQNFLVDGRVAKEIVDALALAEGDCVIEFGPGLGALTEHVIGRCSKQVLVELDRRMAARLVEVYGAEPNVMVVEQDAAKFDLRPYFRERPLKLLGNLPYSTGTAILKEALTLPSPVDRAIFMLQAEVAARLVARPGSKTYGALSLLVGIDWKVDRVLEVGPESFVPQPKVQSSVVRFTPRPRGELGPVDRRLFRELVTRGFSQRRKQLKKLLPAHRELDWVEIVGELGVLETVRAEELELEQWAALARVYGGRAALWNPDFPVGQRADEEFDVVDSHDQVIGRASRAEVHGRGLMHRAVHVLLFNKKGEILLQRRSPWKDTHPGLWDSSAAGHLDVGEDYGSAALREMREELGVGAQDLKRVAILPPSEATGFEHVWVYRGLIDGKVTPAPEEVESTLWLREEDLMSWLSIRPIDFASPFLEVMKGLESGIQGETDGVQESA
jgi:16S rRNA (adenine1518-N6/adenine1519-N6)-dimethyltransferase